MSRPVVLIPACTKSVGDHLFDAVGRKYSAALAGPAACLPLLVPYAGEVDVGALLAIADGVLLTGSVSNVDPEQYGDETALDLGTLDTERDMLTLPLARAAVEQGVPLLGICRGFQEMVVAFGGSLYQDLEAAGYGGHGENASAPLETRYAPAHVVDVFGSLANMLNSDRIEVNSLHGQGARSLGARLTPVAHSPDRLVEAVSVTGPDTFALGVQWHPEWGAASNPHSSALFAAFGAAAQMRSQR